MNDSKTPNLKRVILEPGREASLRNRHPWLFSGAIRKVEGQPEDGDFVEVYSHNRQSLGVGHWGKEGIAVRMLAFEPLTSPQELIRGVLQRALDLRSALGLLEGRQTTAFRLVNAEGDGIPGLVIDLYGQTAVIQCHSAGMTRWKELIVAELLAQLGSRLQAIVDRSPGATGQTGQLLHGSEANREFDENGIRFSVDCLRGQKTGFFLDQRDNRALLERYAKNRSVLNAFCYTGGFSLYALRGGATRVLSVDVSKTAIAAVEANIQAAGFAPEIAARHQSLAADCMEYLKETPPEYDLLVLDPPAFVKHQGALRGGLNGYETINSHALRQLPAGGILFTFSCSQFVTRELFRKVVFKAAARVGRSTRVLAELSQAACHPVNLFHPEGTYLKGLVLYVE